MKVKAVLETVFLRWGLLAWVALICVWWVGSLFFSDEFLPGPLTTVESVGELIASGTLQQDVLVSLARVARGWLLGLAFAIPVGLVVGNFLRVGWFIEPLVNFFRFVPAIGFISLFLMWFGVGEASKTALIFYATIFPVMINTITGVRSVDESLVEAAETLGSSKVKVFFTVIVPSAIPNIFTGIRLGLSAAIICIVAAEMLAASEGIGYLIYTARLYYKTCWIFVGIFVLGTLGFCADKLLMVFGRRVLGRFGVR